MPLICTVCSKNCHSYQGRIQCTSCEGWVHHGNRLNCSGMTDTEFENHITDELRPFECDHCVNIRISRTNSSVFHCLPFVHECEGNIFNVPGTNQRVDVSSMTPEQLSKFVRQCESIQNLINSNTDDDSDELFLTQVNSKYYDMKQLNSLKVDVPSSFGLLHVNIASLNAHIDDLKAVLGRMKFNFDVIGISEHKIREGMTPSNNIDIAGYNEFIFDPTETTCGGTGFYIKNNLDFYRRNDLQLNSPSNYESTFIEIVFQIEKI